MPEKLSSESTHLVPYIKEAKSLTTPGGPLPDLIVASGSAAEHAWDDYFEGQLKDRPHTKAAYERAVRYFLDWARREIPEKALHEIMAGDVGRYFHQMSGGLQKKKQHIAGLRMFSDLLVERHVILINPFKVAKTAKLVVTKGKTPPITDKQHRTLLSVIHVTRVVGLRDRAILSVLAYTLLRDGAVGRLNISDYYDAGDQWMLQTSEKGGKQDEIPVSHWAWPHDLKTILDEYITESEALNREPWVNPDNNNMRRPLFTKAVPREKRLGNAPMTSFDIFRMMKRHVRKAGLPSKLTPHS